MERMRMMIDVTPLANALIMVLAVLITVYLIPWIKSQTTEKQRKEVEAWVKIACAAAEQLYHTDMIQDRKQYVIDFLAKKNLKINPDELDKMIEAAVLEINKEWAEVTEEKKEEATDEESEASA